MDEVTNALTSSLWGVVWTLFKYVFIPAFIVLAIMIFIALIVKKNKKGNGHKTPIYTSKYQPKYIFSFNEKDAYRHLKEIAQKHGYTVLAKVRIYDLVEPRQGIENRVSYINMIQSKHVDFVILDQALDAKWVIELDDNSHSKPARAERDKFVDAVLTETGYKVLHVLGINPENIETFLNDGKTVFETAGAGGAL